MSSRSTPKPWPMKWVVLAIVLFIAIYTFLTLHYRKPGQAYQPYHDNKERAMVHRLREAGFQRITASAEIPAEPTRMAALITGALAQAEDAPGGVPEDLKQTLIDQPRLPQSFSQVRAPAEAASVLAYTFQFTCALPNNKQLLSATYVYVKEQAIAVVADFEKIEGDLLARSSESVIQLTIPANTLRPGEYTVTLIGDRASKRWTLQVH